MALAVVYTTINGQIASENRGGIERDYMPDTLGSTAALLDSTQAKTDTWEYWPYGEVAAKTGTNATRFTYVGTLGYFMDLLDKLLYVRARSYQPNYGRWLEKDVTWPRSQAYGYANQMPMQLVDFSGMTPAIPFPPPGILGGVGAALAGFFVWKLILVLVIALAVVAAIVWVLENWDCIIRWVKKGIEWIVEKVEQVQKWVRRWIPLFRPRPIPIPIPVIPWDPYDCLGKCSNQPGGYCQGLEDSVTQLLLCSSFCNTTCRATMGLFPPPGTFWPGSGAT